MTHLLLQPKHVLYTRPVSRIYGGRPRNTWLYKGRVGYGRHPYTPSLSSLVTCHYTECVPEIGWGICARDYAGIGKRAYSAHVPEVISANHRAALYTRPVPGVSNDTGMFFCIADQTLHCILTSPLLKNFDQDV